ncbi:hypothetical protein D3C76_1136530 [compost metagenome]
MLEVGIRRVEHHADEGDGFQRRAQAGHVRPQAADVVRCGQYRAAHIDATLDLRVIVGVQRGHELHGGFLLEKVHHLRPVTQESLDPGRFKAGTGFVAQVSHGRLRAVVGAVPVAGHPQHTAGKRRGTAKAVVLFDDDHVKAMLLCSNGGRQATSTRPDDQHIAATCGHARAPSKPGRGISAMGMLSSPPSTVSSAPLI